MNLTALTSAARTELGLPQLPDRVVGGVETLAETAPLTVAEAPAFDGVAARLRQLGSQWRPGTIGLAHAANGAHGTAGDPDAVRGARSVLASLYVEGAARGESTIARAPRTDGNRVDLLVRNEQYLPRLTEDLAAATSSITINQFNWEPDGGGRTVLDLIKERARAGVDVRVMVDGYGFRQPGAAIADSIERELADAGVRLVRTGGMPVGGTGFEHRKLITIDDRVSYTGGLGFGAKYDTWTDLMLRMEGPAAAVAGANALGTWNRLNGADPTSADRLRAIGGRLQDAVGAAGTQRLAMRAPLSAGLADATAGVTLLDNRPGADLASTEAFLRDAAGAKHRLWATSTYLTSTDAADALAAAARRGVDTQLIVTSRTAGNDSRTIDVGSSLYRELIEAGVKIHEYPGVLHAKSWLVDDDVAAVGSMNLSRSSMARARELTARVESRAFVDSYADFYRAARAEATQVEPSTVDSLKHTAYRFVTRTLGLQF